MEFDVNKEISLSPKIYICDPDKNTECKKTSCQDLCFCTRNPEFAKEKESEVKENE